MKWIKKILIANRGEIAVRVIRAAREMGISTVAVYHDDDRDALHVRSADEAFALEGESLSETYLNQEVMLAIAIRSGCQAIHPGYGFLSENAEFASACRRSGLVFIGPEPETIFLMGDKKRARDFVQEIGGPLLLAWKGDAKELIAKKQEFEYPLLVKASAGGGGKGIRFVHQPKGLEEAIQTTAREAQNYFGDPAVYLERWVEHARHIEVQVLGDGQGNLVHLFERECTLQRRHQKVVEECPSPTISEATRTLMCDTALRIAREANYISAGTVEFLLDERENFYFLEMNTRIQVEHPVTEMVTGLDLVKEQIRIASGFPLSLRQEDIALKGHAIEARIYAEDPMNGFQASPGRITLYAPPVGDVRLEEELDRPGMLSSRFDSMICKAIVHAETREEAIQKMKRSLVDFHIQGTATNLEFLRLLFNDSRMERNLVHTRFLERELPYFRESIIKRREQVPEEVVLSGFLCDLFFCQRNSDNLNPWRRLGRWRLFHHTAVRLRDREIDLFPSVLDGGFTWESEGETVRVHEVSGEKGKWRFRLGEKTHWAWISDGGKGIYWVEMEGVLNQVVHVQEERSQNLQRKISSELESDEGVEVVAPLPGRVIELKVSPAEQVRKGALLCVIEAMKMENNILAPRDGVVDIIKVKKGDQVENQSSIILIK